MKKLIPKHLNKSPILSLEELKKKAANPNFAFQISREAAVKDTDSHNDSVGTEKLKRQQIRRELEATIAKVNKDPKNDLESHKNHGDTLDFQHPKTVQHAYLAPSSDGYGQVVVSTLLTPWEDSLSESDPIGEFYVSGKVLGPVFSLLGRGAEYGLAKYGFGTALKWARGRIIGREMMHTPLLEPTYEYSAPAMRFKLGDVEINNPLLAYRLGPTVATDLLRNGKVIAIEAPEIKTADFTTSSGGRFTLSKLGNFSNPMFELGLLWYRYPENLSNAAAESLQLLITTAEPLQVATKSSAPAKGYSDVNGTFDVRGNGNLVGGRRILLYDGQLSPENTMTYTWEPGYGYRRVIPKEKLYWFSSGNASTPWYFKNGKWDFSTAGLDIRLGRQNLLSWMNSDAYKKAAEANIKEAESMGLKYVPYNTRPEFAEATTGFDKIKIKTIDKNIGGLSDGSGEIVLNTQTSQDPALVIRHENGHTAKLGAISLEAVEKARLGDLSQMLLEKAFLEYKASQVFKPESEYNGIDLNKNAFEAMLNTRDFGEDLGISIGLSYPGDTEALRIINSYPKTGFKAGLKDMFNLNNPRAIWSSLNGTHFGLVFPFTIGMGAAINL